MIHRIINFVILAICFAASRAVMFANLPTVTFTQPSNNQVFAAGDDIGLKANASEGGGTISQVEFFTGPTSLGVGTGTNSYALDWFSVPAGAYALTAVATDTVGGTGTSAVVNVIVDIPPTVAIASPTEDADFSLPATISITATNFDADGSVTDLVFYANGNPIGELTNPPPSYTVVWAGALPGLYELTAQATDNNGLSTISDPVNIFVTTNGGLLTGSISAISGSVVDLAGEGTNDWAHWGLFTQSSFDHKAGVVSQISNFSLINVDLDSITQYANDPNGYSWRDGTPNTAATNTTTGIYAVDRDTGFQITVPASTNLATLRLYVGSFRARGKLVAYLSDFSANIYLDTSVDNSSFSGPGGSVYTLNFSSAANGQVLTVQYTVALDYNSSGNVTLQAATLCTGNSPPSVAITTPTNGASFTGPTNVVINTAPADLDGTVTKVEFFQGGTTKLGQATNNPFSFTWSNVLAGTYSLAAKATDNQGAIYTSAPVTIFVITNGGILHATLGGPASTVNLTSEGKADWKQWGLPSTGPPSIVNRKMNVVAQISNATNIGSGAFNLYDDNLNAYTWTDGTPILSATTTTGIYKTNLNQGFQISAPADTTLRRLKVYVGAFAAQGKLEATLSDFSTLPFIDSSITSFDSTSAVYTIIYSAASPGKKLNVKYTSTALFDELYGNVTLQAVTLAGPTQPALRIINPLPPSLFAFSFTTDHDWNYGVQFKDSLLLTNWLTLTNFTGDGSDALITDPPASNRFYRVKVGL